MHERSLVAALLDQIDRVVARHGAARAVAVHVSVGEFSGVDAELFQSAFREMSGDSPEGGVVLELDRVGLEARCNLCEREFRVERFHFTCPECGCPDSTVVRGEGLLLESVTLQGALT